jgi:hypothetical protein
MSSEEMIGSAHLNKYALTYIPLEVCFKADEADPNLSMSL